MTLGLALSPGATFRHLMTFYKDNEHGPRQDLTDVTWEVINLVPAPWVIEVQANDLEQGQVSLYIAPEHTKLAPADGQYPFQVRMTFLYGDVVHLQPIVINTGPAYIPSNAEVNPLEPAVPDGRLEPADVLPALPILPLFPTYNPNRIRPSVRIAHDTEHITTPTRAAQRLEPAEGQRTFEPSTAVQADRGEKISLRASDSSRLEPAATKEHDRED